MSQHHNITINVGGLESIASLYKNTSNGLTGFNKIWEKGDTPVVTWDIRNIRSGHMNITAIAFFLAMAHRVRQFIRCRQPCLIEWNPKTFGFLADINFFKIADTYDLFEWPFEIGGYERDQTNPNTMLLVCDPLMDVPDTQNQNQISEFKKLHREYYRQYIIERCEALFSKCDNQKFGTNIALTMSRTCAEIVTNSLLWGQATPFIGLQRSHRAITISVSDIGVGFKCSLLAKGKNENLLNGDNSDVLSIALGSVINKLGFGLKRAISTVTELDGQISIASNTGEIHWCNNIWRTFVGAFDAYAPQKAFKILPQPIFGANVTDKENGYIRSWKHSIRGSRISFTIPVIQKGYKNG